MPRARHWVRIFGQRAHHHDHPAQFVPSEAVTVSMGDQATCASAGHVDTWWTGLGTEEDGRLRCNPGSIMTSL